MKPNIFIIPASVLCILTNVYAQDISYAKKVVDTLASSSMHGRGYVKDGLKTAGRYLENEFKEIGLQPLKGNDYEQKVNYTVNTFPGNMLVKIDGKELTPGRDYLMDPSSGGASGTFDLVFINKQTFEIPDRERNFNNMNLSKRVVAIDKTGIEAKVDKQQFDSFSRNPFGAKAIVQITDDKLTWSVSDVAYNHPVILIKRKAIPLSAKSIQIDIDQRLSKNHASSNILGYVKGSQFPDSFIVFTAHYDHLGMMGDKVYFPGANDNASGVAMLLNLAKYYAAEANKPLYSMAFIAFTGEEAGLSGSAHYVQNPVFPLSKIKFLINMDLLGTGEDGLMVVNGAVYEDQFIMMEKINELKGYLPQIKKRGKAANSDHYYFGERKVKSIFIYTMGGIAAYHDIDDRAKTLPLTKFENVFKLVRDFITDYTKPRSEMGID